MKKLLIAVLVALTPLCYGIKKTTDLSTTDAMVALYVANRLCRVGEGMYVPQGASFHPTPGPILFNTYAPMLAKLYETTADLIDLKFALYARKELLAFCDCSEDNIWFGKDEFNQFKNQFKKN